MVLEDCSYRRGGATDGHESLDGWLVDRTAYGREEHKLFEADNGLSGSRRSEGGVLVMRRKLSSVAGSLEM